MIDVKKRKCRTENCGREPSFGVAGTKKREYCAQHAPDGMVNFKNRKCRTQGYGKGSLFGVAGTKTAEYCAQHTPDGMVDVCSRKCRTESCGKKPSFGVAGTKKREYCAQHAPNGMVDVKNKKCRTQGCGKGPSFGVAGTTTAEYCAQHARLQFDVEKYRDREVGPHHFWKESIGNAIPSGAKHTTVHPPPTKTSQPSGVSPDSHKRVRHPDVTSTMSKRAIARKSTAEAVTMPDIDGQKFPVKRNSSVKTEVQLSL